ncbi:MAG: APC family permease [Candidatus Nanopelagicales bacterium]|nr:APC family permease [Candidatus Nanopelagicales bacterium]
MPSVTGSAKRFFLGRAVRSENLHSTLLPKRIALPVFASDALSSNAYATQEILLMLSMGGVALYSFAPWVAAAVILVFFTVVASYRQNVHAYPSGGGDYEVVSTNLGQRAGVFVASALLVDYVLTVAVSISSAVANIASAFSPVGRQAVLVAVGLIVIMTLMNLRGVRESGTAFAIPTYGFILGIAAMVGWGVWRMSQGEVVEAESANWQITPETSATGILLVVLIARAFSSGTTALTGIEAIANGVPAFRKPKSKNAASTLLLLGVISMAMFTAITWLALATHVKVADSDASVIGLPAGQSQKTVIAQISQAVFSDFKPGYLYISIVTALILVLAANTAFNGFPVLGSILARDGYLPRQLHTRGDRLAFSNGIIFLAGAAAVLVIVYKASVSSLIQLYVIGVFVSFTLSQIGMVRHWNRHLAEEQDPKACTRMKRSRVINFFGAIMTGTVLTVVLFTKFTHGAYLVVIAMPILYLIMRRVRSHYDRVAVELAPSADDRVTLPSRVHAIVLVSKIHRPTLRALAYARATRPSTLEGLTVSMESGDVNELAAEWEQRKISVPLKILDSPYREITRPIVEYVRGLRRASPRDLVCVYIPEYVLGHWWENILHNQSALRLKTRLRFTPGVMVVSVPWQLLSSEKAADVPIDNAPGAVRRGEPEAAVAEAVVAAEYGASGQVPPDPAQAPPKQD